MLILIPPKPSSGFIFKGPRGLGVKGSSKKPEKRISNDEHGIFHRLFVKWRIS